MAIAVLVGDHPGYETIALAEAAPVCGDYCDACGDCLHCGGGDACYGFHDDPEAGHSWIIYLDKAEAFWAEHPDARRVDTDDDESEA